jgi:hypothetical protein
MKRVAVLVVCQLCQGHWARWCREDGRLVCDRCADDSA